VTLSTTIFVALETEPELQYAVHEGAFESLAMRLLPLFVHNLEGNVFVGGTGVKSQNHVVVTLRGLDEVLRGLGRVNQIWIEYLPTRDISD
jgi:hypothetical protein